MIAWGLGRRSSHCQKVRRGGRRERGGRAVMVPLPTFPDTWMLSRAGNPGPSGGGTLTVP